MCNILCHNSIFKSLINMFLFLKCYVFKSRIWIFKENFIREFFYKGWTRFEECSNPLPLPFLAGSMILRKYLTFFMVVTFLIYKEKLIWFDFCYSNLNSLSLPFPYFWYCSGFSYWLSIYFAVLLECSHCCSFNYHPNTDRFPYVYFQPDCSWASDQLPRYFHFHVPW